MAKKLVKKAATAASKKPVKKPARPAAPVKPSAKAAKSSTGSSKTSAKLATKPASKSVASARSKVVPPTKAVVTKSKPANGKAVVVPSTKLEKVAAKNGVVEKRVTHARTVVASAKAPLASAKAPVTNLKAPTQPTAAVVVIAAKGSVTKVAEAPKPSGRPMLLQGPIAVRPMGKKATLPITPEKPKTKTIKKRLPLSDEPKFVVIQPPTKAVATSEKAAKNKAGFGQKDLDFFRDLLLAKRRELLGDMNSMEREALRENSTDLSNLPVHMADQGTDAYEQEFTLHLVEKDRSLLRELNDALAKIQNGTYGICEGTGLPISKPRLEAQPWARHSIEHARALEKRAGMFRR